MTPDEETLIRAFIAAERRPRWLEFLRSEKKRARFLDRLNHCRDFDPRFVEVQPSNADVAGILTARDAPTVCHVISAAEDIDGRTMQLSEAVVAAEQAGWGTLIGCIPGRLAYFYDECGERRFLLARGGDSVNASQY